MLVSIGQLHNPMSDVVGMSQDLERLTRSLLWSYMNHIDVLTTPDQPCVLYVRSERGQRILWHSVDNANGRERIIVFN
jgi:hypothetical protein